MIKENLKLVPHLPGSYQMYNELNIVIYVGKAKDLKNRLSSYFNGKVTGKTAKMVSEIKYFKYIVTNTENEAFILELNLIKKYNPKYNILLKDDKSYPYIEYTSKPYPKLKIVRYLNVKKNKDKKLFGPYPNQYAARRIVKLINRLYPLKKCDTMPKSVCLYYHIHECLGYCQKNVDKEKINEMEKEIISFLKGDSAIITDRLKKKIEFYSRILNYEKALELKNELDYISAILAKQKVELSDLINRDVINYYIDKNYISINIFFLRHGKLLGNKNDIFPLIDEPTYQIENYIGMFYKKNEIPKEIIIPETLSIGALSSVIDSKIVYAKIGKKKKLLDLVKTNAKIMLENNFKLIERDEARTEKANEELKNILKMKNLYRIDIFDNSNLFGEYCVSGMVVYKNGVPSKKDYRKFKISLEKNDDYNTMKEVIYRRYYRALIESSELPDLIIVDGGENQIRAAADIIDKLNLKIKIIGLKKDDNHRTNKLIDSNLNEIDIDIKSNLFFFLTRMQDEVHRFTINYHRQIRSKGSIASILENIEGIGIKREKLLLKQYGSLKNIAAAEIEDLEKILPRDTAIKLKDYLKKYLK